MPKWGYWLITGCAVALAFFCLETYGGSPRTGVLAIRGAAGGLGFLLLASTALVLGHFSK